MTSNEKMPFVKSQILAYAFAQIGQFLYLRCPMTHFVYSKTNNYSALLGSADSCKAGLHFLYLKFSRTFVMHTPEWGLWEAYLIERTQILMSDLCYAYSLFRHVIRTLTYIWRHQHLSADLKTVYLFTYLSFYFDFNGKVVTGKKEWNTKENGVFCLSLIDLL